MPMTRRSPHPGRFVPLHRSSLAIASLLVLGNAQAWGAWSAAGVVKSNGGTVLPAVEVTVKDSGTYKTTTNDKGEFKLESSASVGSFLRSSTFSIRRSGDVLMIGHPGEGILEVSLLDASGSVLWTEHAALVQGTARARVPARGRELGAILMVRLGSEVHSQVVPLGSVAGWNSIPAIAARSMAAPYPTLVFKKDGYADTTLALTSDISNGLAVVLRDTSTKKTDFVEDHRSECAIPTLPAVSSLTNNAYLPDPFKMLDGTAVTTKAQWKCHREVVAAMLEKYIHGEKPRNPEKVEGSFSGNKLTVKVTDKGKSISFSVTITKPTSGTGPFAAVIGWDGGNIGGFNSLPVAKISYPITTIASEGSGRGKGLFYDLYGSNHSASELMAHAWGLSRIIDALMVTPEAGIDPKRLAVTGCSRWGKSSTIAGSFDRRVKLVIPQESGSGGVASWRIIPAFSDAQPIKSTYDEQYWTRQDFWQNFGSSINKLPVDHHQMIGMIAPNGLLVLDNSIAWLGPQVGYGSSMAAKEIFAALGATESITYSSVGGHTHCAQPTSQDHWVKSYMQKFLLDGTGEAAKMEAPSDYKFDRAKWINWTTPTLK